MPERPPASRRPRPPGASYPRRAAGLALHEVEDGYIVSDATGDRVHHLNATAALIIELCTGANSTAEIVDLVKQTYQLRHRPEQEVAEILARMRSEGLIE